MLVLGMPYGSLETSAFVLFGSSEPQFKKSGKAAIWNDHTERAHGDKEVLRLHGESKRERETQLFQHPN